MRTSILRLVLLGGMLLGIFSAHGQWGIRITPFHIENLNRTPSLHLVVGLDKDLSIRSGLGVEFTYHLISLPTIFDDYSSNYYSGDYELARKTWGLTLRSQYFFSDNDQAAFYLGPFIGVRKTDQAVTPPPKETSVAGYTFLIPQPTVHYNSISIPVGLRTGVRMALSGYTQDLYIGLGYHAGSNNYFQGDYYRPKDKFSKFYFQAGLSFGIGWD